MFPQQENIFSYLWVFPALVFENRVQALLRRPAAANRPVFAVRYSGGSVGPAPVCGTLTSNHFRSPDL